MCGAEWGLLASVQESVQGRASDSRRKGNTRAPYFRASMFCQPFRKYLCRNRYAQDWSDLEWRVATCW